MKLVVKIIISAIVVVALVFIPMMVYKSLSKFQDEEAGAELEVNFTKIRSSYNWETLLNIAQKDFELNEDLADSAPKQTVVTLWGIKDKQTILILQNENIINQNYEIAKQNAHLVEIQKQTNFLILYIIIAVLFFGTVLAMISLWKKL